LPDLCLWDTHAHLTDKRFSSTWRDVLDDAWEAGVHGVINISVDAETSREALRQARLVPDRMRVTVGCHPHESSHMTPDLIDELKVMAKEDSVVASWRDRARLPLHEVR